jgi:myo-inositol-1(or 4)-monophosphatase
MANAILLTDYLDGAKTAALRAAAVLDEWRSKFRVAEKGPFDLVTDADVASQRTIQQYLLERFPGHGVLGEEEGASQARPDPDAPPTWIIDPIDGTTNYVHDFPFYCISIGLQVGGDLAAGVVYDPRHGEMFSAATGMGAWLNDQRLQTSRVGRLDQALIATGFPPNLRGNERALEWWRYLSFKTQSLRRTGSTALNIAYIAAGRFDGYWAFDNHIWDVAAATVILREAGGQITNVDGTPYDPYTPDALASNGPLQPVLLQLFRAGIPPDA